MDVQSEEIPQEVWNIILPCGNYLKKIMELCGYTRKESIVKLKETDERDKMFTFVKSMSEVIEDKHAVFSVFSKCPDKVMLLPGLEQLPFMSMPAIFEKQDCHFQMVKFLSNCGYFSKGVGFKWSLNRGLL